MLRQKNFTRRELIDCWQKVNELFSDKPLALDYIRTHLFGEGRHEFLGELGQNLTPHPNRLPTDNPVYIDAAGRLYYPHESSDVEHDTVSLVNPCTFTDTWFVKVALKDVIARRTPVGGERYDEDSPLVMPKPDDELVLRTKAGDRVFAVTVFERLERRDATAMVRFNELLSVQKHQSEDLNYFFQSLRAVVQKYNEQQLAEVVVTPQQ